MSRQQPPDDIGIAIRRYRQQRGWSLSELARRSGVSKSYIHEIERCRSQPTIAIIDSLAAALGVCVSDLLPRGGNYIALPFSGVLTELAAERRYQDQRWGVQNHRPEIWLTILGEEVGEANRETLQAWSIAASGSDRRRWLMHLQQLRQELLQVAAVAVAAVESLDRNELGGTYGEIS